MKFLRHTGFLLTLLTALSQSAVAQDSVSISREKGFRLLFRASGQVTFGVHLWGRNKYTDLAPGYRSHLLIHSSLVRYADLYLDFLTLATTSIARLPETPIKMDKIRYTLAPSLRHPFKKSLLTLDLYHECIHTISRDELEGSTWWNKIRLGGGTLGAYPQYFIRKYNNRDFSVRNSLDVQADLGVYLRGHSQWIAQNHDYRADLSGLIRYHVGFFRNQTLFFDLRHHLWYGDQGDLSGKLSGELDFVILARNNIATFYVNHCFIDENPHDNEASLGAIGFKVAF